MYCHALRALAVGPVLLSGGLVMTVKALLARIVGVALSGVAAGVAFTRPQPRRPAVYSSRKSITNSPGADYGINTSLSAEWVQIKNVTAPRSH
jgi:hypothetical protein